MDQRLSDGCSHYKNQKSTESQDILRELPYEEWPCLRDVYKNEWPFAIYSFYVVENFIKWKRKDPSVRVRILCPRVGYQDGTMALIHDTDTLSTLYLFTLEKSCKMLQDCLLRTNLIDWTVGPYIHSIHGEHWPAVRNALDTLKLPIEYDLESSYHWISKEKAMNFKIECPPDVYIAQLEEKDIKTMNDIWPHRYPGSEALIRSLIFVNGGLGIFSKEDGSLRSWIIKNNHLGLGLLQTLEEHKRKGYAKLMIMAMSKNMAIDDLDIHTCILRKNIVSLDLFKSLGFEKVDNLNFRKIKPKVKSHM